ncbi:MAG: hypothetical protein IKD08_00875 [Alphaproteobacteria bacterium]|nr:hypothetical protein [Alphaproteobacteria bacterium]
MTAKAMLICEEDREKPIKRILSRNGIADYIQIEPVDVTGENENTLQEIQLVLAKAKSYGKSGVLCCSYTPVLAVKAQQANIRTIAYTIEKTDVMERRNIFCRQVRETCSGERMPSFLIELANDTIPCILPMMYLQNGGGKMHSRA